MLSKAKYKNTRKHVVIVITIQHANSHCCRNTALYKTEIMLLITNSNTEFKISLKLLLAITLMRTNGTQVYHDKIFKFATSTSKRRMIKHPIRCRWHLKKAKNNFIRNAFFRTFPQYFHCS